VTGVEAVPQRRGVSFELGDLSPIPPEGDSWDEWVIERGITAAIREARDIDDRTAHYISAQLHEGQTSALYSLASAGAIDEPHIHHELEHGSDALPLEVQRWINWLGEYALHRTDKGPVDGWNERVHEQDRLDAERLRTQRSLADLDELFTTQLGAEMGDVSELGWFGAVVRPDRPGGLILALDEQGFRHVWETDRNEELIERWEEVNQAYDRYYQALARQSELGRPALRLVDREAGQPNQADN
jgi:hypothetical protein